MIGSSNFSRKSFQREVRGRGVSTFLPFCRRLASACSEVSPVCGVEVLCIVSCLGMGLLGRNNPLNALSFACKNSRREPHNHLETVQWSLTF